MSFSGEKNDSEQAYDPCIAQISNIKAYLLFEKTNYSAWPVSTDIGKNFKKFARTVHGNDPSWKKVIEVDKKFLHQLVSDKLCHLKYTF